MEIKSLRNIEYDLLYSSFRKAFKDYDIQLTKDELFSMLQRRGFVAELSFGAFDKGQIVAFTFNGIGVYNNIKTAYDTGTGTIEEYRGKGLASQIFEYSLPYLREAKVEHYLLEVLQHNTKAISVYQKLGFKTQREFYYFIQEEPLKTNDKTTDSSITIKTIDMPRREITEEFSDFVPSWQNSFDAISRKQDDFKIQGAFIDNELTGYCISEPETGDITQIAVNKNHRRKGIGTLLFKESLIHNKCQTVKIVNTAIDCDSINKFAESQGLSVTGKQFEMIKDLKLS